MNLVRDCLDKQLVDRNQRNMGKCDGIIMSFDDARQPRISHIEVGAVTRAARIHPLFARIAKKLSRRFGGEDPIRIPWSKVVVSGTTITVGVDAEKTPALAWEMWLRRKVIGRIPGA
ncbi:MAG: hypothetical protein ABR555_17760 [Pyrinomonadaceae bacterium]